MGPKRLFTYLKKISSPPTGRNPIAAAPKTQAEAEKFLAEAGEAKSLARKHRAEAKILELALERDLQEREDELSANAHHKVYVFDQAVEDKTVKSCINQLTGWSRQDPECDIEIQVNSPGGVIFAGFALIDFIRDLRSKGHKVTMVTFGMAASMAGVLLQAADVRVMGENAFLLIHEGSMGAIGDFGDIEDRVELMGLMHERILALFEERARPINEKTTVAFIRNRWKRKDWWITAENAKKLGFVDEVR